MFRLREHFKMKLTEGNKKALLQLAAAVIEAYGLPGLIVVYVMFVLEFWGTRQQHEQIIDMYLLGKGAYWFPAAIVSIVAMFVVLAQHRRFTKRLKIKDDELKRAGDEKSRVQQERIDAPLHHGDEEERQPAAKPVPKKPVQLAEGKKKGGKGS